MKLSLQQIAVEGFRGVESRIELDFSSLPPGLYFVRGRNEAEPRLGSNGAGKSTCFLESISYALTGRLSRVSRPGASVENWHSDGPTKVAVSCEFDAMNHVVSRTRAPNDLLLDGTKVDQATIDRLMPLSDAALRRSILIEQFGDMFLNLSPEQKSRMFSDALDLEKWLVAADRAGRQAADGEKRLQGLTVKLSRVEGSIATANSQYETVRRQEEAYDATAKQQLAEACQKRRLEAENAKKAGVALDNAREVLAGFSDDDVKQQLEAGRKKVKQLSGEQANIGAGIRGLEAELRRDRDQLKAYADTKTCPECGQQVTVAHIRTRRQELTERIRKCEDGIRTSRKNLEASRKESEEAEAAIRDLEEELEDANAAQMNVSIAAEQSISATKALHVATAEVKRLEEQVNPYTLQCDNLERDIKKHKAERKEIKADIVDIERSIEIYKFWQRGFREIRLEQIDSAILELEVATNRHAEALGLEGWYVEYATERQTLRGTTAIGFSVFLYPPGQDEPKLFELYSGGESQRWLNASTFALAEVLLARGGVETDFEMLDEPTAHLSAEGIDDLLECLKQRATELQRRIFLIDHHVLDRGVFDGVLTVVKNKQGTYVEDDTGLVVKRRQRERERVKL